MSLFISRAPARAISETRISVAPRENNGQSSQLTMPDLSAPLAGELEGYRQVRTVLIPASNALNALRGSQQVRWIHGVVPPLPVNANHSKQSRRWP
jgi:hypothetical protein